MYQERRNNRDEKFSHWSLVPPSFFFIHFLVNLKTHKEIPTISPLKDDDDSNFYFNERTNNSHEANKNPDPSIYIPSHDHLAKVDRWQILSSPGSPVSVTVRNVKGDNATC